jgi:hypothetical protein
MNKPPKILQITLLVVAFAGVAVWGWRGFRAEQESARTGGQAAAEAQPIAQPESERLVLITYFTSDQRCTTCLRIEKQTRDAVQDGFAAELGTGTLRFQTVNFDRPENKHFIGDYGLAFKTVVISERHQGKETKWDRYDKVWELASKPEAFAAYLREGIRAHLKSNTDA